ncbi:MAG: YibE/F family protein [Defluviitaleaceae bacterium]|nr:YibE/F family protein [Defluviitaleaceae bacterium]
MQFKLTKDVLFFLMTSIGMVVMVVYGINSHIDFGFNALIGVTFPTGRVVEVVSDETTIDETGLRMGRQVLRVELLTGKRRGDVVDIQHTLFIGHSVHAEVGSRLVLYFEQFEGAAHYFVRVHSFERATAIYVIALLFIGLLGAVFGKAGLRSAYGLVFTFVVIIFWLIPMIVSGGPPAVLTVLMSLLIITVSLVAVMGFEKKTCVSILGTMIGIGFYGIFYVLISHALNISGTHVPEMASLAVIGFTTHARLGELLFCAILIASLGAIMDVAVSIASVTAELSESNPDAGFKMLFRSGMKISRDLIGSSANTLILAFTGSFLIALILFRTDNVAYDMLMNQVNIGIEVLRAISAFAAMVLAAPATAVIGSHVYGKNHHFKN